MELNIAKQTLLTRRNALIGHMIELEHSLDEPLPQDWEDRSSERQGDEVLEALGQADRVEVRRIEAALARITAGQYGYCLTCGEMIADERLAVLPDTPFCRTCAATIGAAAAHS